MALKNPADIVRAYMTLYGKERFVYNDKIRGGRSLKVVGWKKADYEAVVPHLERAGWKVVIRRTPELNLTWCRGGAWRIHAYGVNLGQA